MRLPLWIAGLVHGVLMPAKRVLAVALTLLLAVSFAAPSGARALSEAGFLYTVSDGAATVTGCTSTCPTTLVIPATLGGNAVTTIGISAFYDNDLTSVTIPNSVTTIRDSSFSSNAITSMTIGNSVTTIGEYAFYDNELDTVTIPNSVTTIREYAFSTNDLTTVTIGNSVTTIGNSAFSFNALTTVTIPNSVTAIGDIAFYRNLLETVTIGNSVASIGSFAFSDNALTSVTIPNLVTSIGNNSFAINALTSVTIPNSVTSIGNSAFAYNAALTSVTFLGNAPTDGGAVFNSNSSLTSVTRSHTATGWGSTWSDVPVIIADVRATATVKPSMSGTVAVGKTLTAAPGTWAGYPTPTLTYKWYACTRAVTAARDAVPSTCKVISGATRSTFKLTTAQRGKYVAVLVTGASLGTAATTWLSTTSVDVRATAIYKPAIRGTTTVGKTLTAAKGTWTGYPTPTFTYQWYACTRAVTIARTTVPSTCVQISGATRSTFKLTTAQRGKYVAVLVTGTSLRTTATTWLSKTTAKVR
jgi:hypothetical protein